MITTLIFSPADMPGLLRSDPSVSDDNATKYGPILHQTAVKYQINTPLRLAHWLAQVAHESGGLKYTRELGSGEAYEGNKGLGNTKHGDGPRFLGRGLIQVTGRYNYGRYAKFCGINLLESPELLEALPLAADSAGWFWRHGATTDCNKLADKDDLKGVTRVINGGYRGLADRKARLAFYRYEVDRIGTKIVQLTLNSKLAYPQLVVDGSMGPQTRSIVRQYQSDFFISPTGDVDEQTWKAMCR